MGGLFEVGFLPTIDRDPGYLARVAADHHPPLRLGATTGLGAIAMNKDTSLHWNTIWMGFGWFDIRDPQGEDPAGEHPSVTLAGEILAGVLPEGCVQGEDPTDAGGDPPPRRG